MDNGAELRHALNCELVADVAHRFGEVHVKVTGTSMLPSIRPGDTIVVARQGIDELSPGQLVLCRRGKGLVAHRIVGHRGGSLITRGDTHGDDDPPVHGSEIVGRVAAILRDGHRIDPEQSLWCRVGAWLVRRSELFRIVLLRVH
jgi:hypothetical protein